MAQMKVVETQNYDMFKRLIGNREDIERRAKNIKKSISEHGQIQPILVNEKNEVIDGQARLECCRGLGIPVKYLVIPKLGIDDCRTVNSNSSKWTLSDWINSYADSGDVSYIYLKHIIASYRQLGIRTIISIATGMQEWNKNVKAGKFDCDEARYEKVCKALTYCLLFEPVIKDVKGRRELYYIALGFCYSLDPVDNDALYEKVMMNQLELIPVATTEQALTVLERIYNYRLSAKNKVMLAAEYKAIMMKKYSWYQKRYGG